MNTYIATAFYTDDSHYPNIGWRTSQRQAHDLYWRCMLVMFASSVRLNPEARHLLYSNAVPPQRILAALHSLGVTLIAVPFNHQPPARYWPHFNGSFYVLDALEHCACTLDPGAQVLFVDPDCIWVNSGQELFQTLQRDGLVNYRIDYAPDYSVHGLTRLQAQQVFTEIAGRSRPGNLDFFGGELYGFTVKALRSLLPVIESAWKESLWRFEQGEPKFNTEEQLFNYIFWATQNGLGNGNRFIRRLWTAAVYRNTSPSDTNLTIWHAPAEKSRGFRTLADAVLNRKSEFWTTDPLAFRSFVGRQLTIPNRTVQRALRDSSINTVRKLQRFLALPKSVTRLMHAER